MTEALANLFADISRQWIPPPDWTVSEWADRTRRLSSESSAEPGQWRTSRAEYQRGIMDAVNDAKTEQVIVMSSAQVGKTEAVNNVVGYHIDFDACPMLVVQPTLDMAETWSKDRLTPMLRDTPEIGQKVTGKSRKSQNKILHKSFPGGHVTIAGANAPASLASRPVRLVLCDEVDRYPASAGSEGDPVNLAIKRTSTFWNRKILLVSTPTVKGHSRIEDAFDQSDKRYYQIPCPHCGTMHRLQWANVRWKEEEPKTARFICPHCDAEYTTAQKNAAVRRGEWVASAKFKGKAGFHLSELYSPWRHLHETVADFLEAKGSPEKLQVWVNTCLGETWEEGGKVLDENELISRRENYAAPVPARALILTAGVDVQPDRLELEVVGWGAGEESWSVDYHVINGDPDIPEGSLGSPWTDLTDYLRQEWQHESGQSISVSYTFVDSGGSNTQAVYNYVKRHKGGRVFAIKGRGGEGLPIVGAPNRRRSGKLKRTVDLYIVGVDNAKAVVTKRLEIDSPGPGYCHFPAERESTWFRGLTAETMVTKMVKGRPKREWKVIEGRRNEPLDCRVYAFAALVMASPQFDKIALRMKRRGQTMKKETPAPQPEPKPKAEDPQPTAQDEREPEPQTATKRPKPKRRRASFVQSWRN
jgi:phage terminase large subunit GpA-like protein